MDISFLMVLEFFWKGEDPILTPITDELVQAFVHQVMGEFHGETHG